MNHNIINYVSKYKKVSNKKEIDSFISNLNKIEIVIKNMYKENEDIVYDNHILSVYDNIDIFTINEKKLIHDKIKFKNNFNKLTQCQFTLINMNNVFIVGDSVFFSLLNKNININHLKYFDVKIFLYGLNKSDAISKIKHIFERISSINITKCKYCLTDNYFIIFSNYPYRNIRIKLCLYKSKTDILINEKYDIINMN